jgi:alpha-ketoglutarate-dependent taurine dioxygenase
MPSEQPDHTSLAIEAAGATLGAVVRGVQLSRLDASEWRAIETAFHEHAVLIFPGQHLSHAVVAEQDLLHGICVVAQRRCSPPRS